MPGSEFAGRILPLKGTQRSCAASPRLRSPLSGRFSRSVRIPAGNCIAGFAVCALFAVPLSAPAQVFVVEPEHISRHYSDFQPTDIKLSSEPMTRLDREELIRFLQSEQGFAMRPLPVGILTLRANGGMEPSGDKYIDELHAKGISAKPGDRVVITDVKIEDNRIVFDLNNGPYHKHRFLRHVSIGMNPYQDTPVAADDGPPTGSRITLVFPSRLPDLTGEQVEALLKPMIDFGVKSPAEAYAESLPPFLRKAVEEHRVLVGMDKDMVLYAKGEPIHKIREQENGKNVEIWLYGESPQPVEFVHFDGSFVVRVELAKVGEPLQVRTADEMQGYWGNQPVVAANQRQIQLGDRSAQSAAEEDAPVSTPTLRNPGEKLPADSDKNSQSEGPVNWPPGMQRPGDPGYKPPAAGQSGTPSQSSSQSTSGSQSSSQTSTATQTSSPAQQQGSAASSQQQGTGSSSSSTKQPPATTPPPSSTPQQFVSPSSR